MEKIEKLIFSTKETLKWGFILGGVLTFIPFLAFAVPSNEIEVNMTYDFLGVWVSGGMPIDYHVGFIANQYFSDWNGQYTGYPSPGTYGVAYFDNGISVAPTLPIRDWEIWEAQGFNITGMWIYVGEEKGYNEILGYYGDYIYIPPDAEIEIELRVFGITPASGSTATSTNVDFIIGWEGWDFDWIYKDFVFSFYEKNTRILTGTIIFEPTDEAGTTTLKFLDFGIDKNGEYYFHAKARSWWAIEYPVYYTGDLVSPEWWVNIQVEGWTPIFEMPIFETWYSEHSKFATSTAIFSGVAGLLSPIYNKIGEFGDRAVSFLNLNEAYDRGYDLGKIIPLFRHYVSFIEAFFGGFPIIQLFLAFLVILLGIFIMRLILKFIPGMG